MLSNATRKRAVAGLMELVKDAKITDEMLGRVRGSLGAIFMSDLATADGKYLEQHVTEAGCKVMKRSSYYFPKEEPSVKD